MFTKLITPAVALGIFLVGALAIGQYNPHDELSVLAPATAEATFSWSSPTLSTPTLSAPSLSGTPTLTSPNLTTPTLSTPTLDTPQLSTPTLDVPELDTPELDVPDLDVPDLTVPELDVPDLDVPELDVPELDVPELDVPDLDIPDSSVRFCRVLANVSTVTSGGSVTISWQTQGYDTLQLNGETVSGPNGQKTFTNITQNTTYTLTAKTNNGNYTCTQSVTVSCIPPTPVCLPNNQYWNPEVDLTGEIFDGQKGKVTNASDYCTYPIGLASYKKLDNVIDNQELFDADTTTIGPNSMKTLMVDVPNCAYQIDLFYGDLLTSLDGQRYGTRLLDDKHLNSDKGYCDHVQPEVPSCDLFQATPNRITRGENSTLRWETTNASRVVINNGVGEVAADGTKVVAPLDDVTYRLTVFDSTNQVKDVCDVSLIVDEPEPTDATIIATKIICTDEADLPNWGAGGPNITSDTATNWVATHDSCYLANDWSFQYGPSTVFDPGDTVLGTAASPWVTFGPTGTNGVASVVIDATNPIDTLWFREVLKADFIPFTHGQNNNTNVDNVSAEFYCHADVLNYDNREFINDVTAGETYHCVAWNVPETPVDTVPECVSFTSDKASLPAGGGAVLLTWETKDATAASISPIVGAVNLSGTTSVNVTVDTLFTLTAVDANGDQDARTVAIDVQEEVPVVSCANNVSFTSSRSVIQDGESVVLTWNTTGLNSISITDVGNPGDNGTAEVRPMSDKTYILSATAADGSKNIQCPLTITVDEGGGGGGGGGGGSSSPRCDLDISATRIDEGDEITLRWDTSRATEVSLVTDDGDVIFTTDDYLADEKEEWYDGSIDLRPRENTTYTLLAERGSRDRECEVSVRVNEGDEVVVIEDRDQPLVAGIALSQVPYTGFEAGPILTTLFYALLIAWALFVTYVLVIKQDSIGGVSLVTAPAGAPRRNGRDDVAEMTFIPKQTYQASVVATPTLVAAPIGVPSNLPIGQIPMPVVSAPATISPNLETAPTVYESEIENIAHAEHVLLSSDAIRYFMQAVEPKSDQKQVMHEVIKQARASYPEEDGWVVLNQKRMEALCHEQMSVTPATKAAAEAAVPIGAGSLAEAIVTGNVAAAYQMIGSRPMIALADAAADLDAAYRARQGQSVTISNLLKAETDKLSEVQLKEAIAALTSALDGVYTSEAEAVKMAIMKAVKAVA